MPVSVLLAVSAALTGCSGTPDAAPRPPASASPGWDSAPLPPPDPGRDVARCREFTAALGSARAPIDAMHAGPVLGPFIAFIELTPRLLAEQGAGATDAGVAVAMGEVRAAIDELDGQATAALPAGADPTGTTVKLDPTRLATALDSAEQACAPLLR